jgi:hypothetical protein
MRSGSSLALAALALTTAACSRRDAGEKVRIEAPPSSSVPAEILGAGEVRIVSADSGVDLALLRDSISGGLSQKTLATARHSIDTATVKSTGLGASIAKLVKSSVSSAIGTRVVFPLSSVKDVRYDAGRLRFEWNGKPAAMFETTKVNDKPLLESFRPEDARRFVDVVRARKRALGQL